MSYRHEHFYEYAKPIETKGGIKARTQRGHSFGSNWWSARWAEIMANSIDAGRLARGRGYARKGQVMDIIIEEGLVTAKVQGSRRKPYQIRLGFEIVCDDVRSLLLCSFRENASFAAQLLAGVLPEETEQMFKNIGINLFPTRNTLRQFKCSCPDGAVPCKHVIAVLMLLGEEIRDDPFILLKLHGLDRESLINLLTLENGCREDETDAYTADDFVLTGGNEDTAREETEEEMPLTQECFKQWFKRGEFSFERAALNPHRRAAAIDAMNDFPFWRGEHPFRQTLAPIYERAATTAAEILTGEKKKPIGRPKKLI
ncbi:MAG: SWIM zinc finger family protein [Synergistes sp.]|nr:SWIM zinc finger family protein [Synergistes sp.]